MKAGTIRGLATLMSFTLAFTPMSSLVAANAENVVEQETVLMDGSGYDYLTSDYQYVWGDEFDGTELNRNDWNVETHKAGWVNSEWQEYVDDSKVFEVSNGILKIKPVKESEEVEVDTQNLISNADFSDGKTGWSSVIQGDATGSDSIIDGGIKYNLTNVGTADWHVQLKHNVALENGKKYKVSYKIKSTVGRKVCCGVMDASYEQYGQKFTDLSDDTLTPVEFEFTANKSDETATFYFSLGKMEGDTPSSNIEITDIKLIEANAVSGTYTNLYPSDETIIKDITSENVGNVPWDIQVLKNVSLLGGHTYKVTFTASSTVSRTIVAGVQQTSSPWGQYGQATVEITTEPKEYSYEFDMSTDDSSAGCYFNLGKSVSPTVTPESTVTIKDISLIDTNEDISGSSEGGESTTRTVDKYYSGRISTQNKKTYTYGLFEARAKVPVGQGFLPAFWMMANDESVYGQWPRCGEIDCMEVKGQDTDKVYGTIHYGNPHKESQGTKLASTLTNSNSFSDDYHVFACEWEPGKITWYVDGVKYHEENRWYSTTEGQGTLSYPAPFDQPFYIILNLAIGGDWVGDPDESTEYGEASSYNVDYVRVYQKNQYDENVEAPEEEPVVYRQADISGNFIHNSNFAIEETLTGETGTNASEDWTFLKAAGGEAAASIVSGENSYIKIDTTNAGTQLHSVQLVQAGLTFYKGAKYKVKFKAKSDDNRTMNVDIKAHNRGWSTYMDTMEVPLTNTWQEFEKTFTMTSTTDPDARIEFNMGNLGSTDTIYITDVILEYAEPFEYDAEADNAKTVLTNGNYVYNGRFQEGTGRLGYWDITGGDAESYKVTSLEDDRRLEVKMPNNALNAFVLSQNDLAFEEGKEYKFSVQAESPNNAEVYVNVGGTVNKTFVIDSENKKYEFKISQDTEFNNRNIIIGVKKGTVYLDNVSLMEDVLIKNGSFNDGTTGYELYKEGSVASIAVDSLNNDNALEITIDKTADADYKVQVKHNNVKLEKGKTYRLKYDAKSSMDRHIRVILQGGESLGWPVYSHTEDEGDGIVSVSSDWNTYTHTFEMTAETDEAAFLSICAGAINGNIINEHHVVTIDNISLVEIENEDPETPEDPEETVNEYVITLDVNGGDVVSPSSLTVNEGEEYGTLPTPSRAGYTFIGWFTLAEGGEKVDENTICNGIATIYAQWQKVEDEITPTPTPIEEPTVSPTPVNPKPNDPATNNGWGDIDEEDKADFDVTSEIPNDKITVCGVKDSVYTGSAVTFDVRVYEGTDLLSQGTDYSILYKNNKNAAEKTSANAPTVIIRGKGSHSKINETKTFTIAPLGIEGEGFAVTNNTILKTAKVKDTNPVKPVPTVTYNGKKLKATDYEVEYDDAHKNGFSEIGTYNITVKGKNNYTGTLISTFRIADPATSTLMSKAVVKGLAKSAKYTASDIELTGYSLKAKVGKTQKELTKDVDYTVSYKNNKNIGVASIIFTAKEGSGLVGEKVVNFKITGTKIQTNKITLKKSSDDTAATIQHDYTGKRVTPAVVITSKDGQKTLTENVDYKVEYLNNINAGKATVVITGIGAYDGVVKKAYKINPIKLTDDSKITAEVTGVKKNSRGKYEVTVVVKCGDRVLDENGDYTLAYKNNTKIASKDAGKSAPTVLIKGKGNYARSLTLTFDITE